jgi:hypothetical protein
MYGIVPTIAVVEVGVKDEIPKSAIKRNGSLVLFK